jgi:hypothetical protein
MNRVEKIFMDRDGCTPGEAKREYELLREDILQAAEDGYFEDAEDMLLSSGLDLDYMIDMLI